MTEPVTPEASEIHEPMVNATIVTVGILLIIVTTNCAQPSPTQRSFSATSTDTVGGPQQEDRPQASLTLSHEMFRNLSVGAQAIVTALALVVGGWLAWRNKHLFRYGQPHLTIGHEISHRQVSPGYVQIGVTAVLHNSSRVKVEVLDGLFTV